MLKMPRHERAVSAVMARIIYNEQQRSNTFAFPPSAVQLDPMEKNDFDSVSRPHERRMKISETATQI